MKLTTLHIGVPIFWLQASVEHSVIRKPTAFERMIMRLSRRGIENPEVGAATLRAAFEEHLGASGVPRLLESSATELLRLGIIHSTEAGTGVSVLDQPIRTLTLSTAGQEFYNRNTLPSNLARDAAEFYYLPWSNSLSSERPSRLVASPPALAFDAHTLSPRDPSSLVRATLAERPPRFLRGESRVVTVEVDVDETVNWLILDVELVVTPEGYLSLHVAGNKAATGWVARLEPTLVQTTILDSVVTRTSRSGSAFPSEFSHNITSLVLADPVHGIGARTVELPDLTVRIQLDAEHASASWLSEDDSERTLGAPLSTGWPADLESVTVSDSHGVACRMVGELPLTWGGQQVFAPVQIDLDAETAGPAWDAISDALAVELAQSDDPSIAALPLAWFSPRPAQALASRVAGRPLDEVLDLSRDFVLAADDAAPSFVESRVAALLGDVSALISSATVDRPVSIDVLSEWTRTLQGALGTNAPLAAVLSPLVTRLAQPRSAIEVREVLRLSRLAGSLPPHLFSAEVLTALLSDLWRDPSTDLGAPDHAALQTIANYAAAQVELDATLGRQNATFAQESVGRVAAGSVGTALNAAERWLHAVEDPNLARLVDGKLPDGLVSLRADVLKWRETATSNMASALAPGQGALVFDSNSLLDEPEGLRDLRAGQVGVIPNRVIQELDGLKRSANEDTARRARAAHRAIDDVRQLSTLRFESGRPALIPPDLGAIDEPDNQILSVAIAYSRGNVVLVTRDNNLRAKAQATGVSAKGWPEIQEARGERQ